MATAVPRNKKRRSVIHHAPTIAERDGGWLCHYCGIKLIPPGTPDGTMPYYRAEIIDTLQGVDENWNEIYGLEEIFVIANGYAHAAVDHKLAFARGGGSELSNLVLACEKCNAKKRDKSYGEFTAWLEARS